MMAFVTISTGDRFEMSLSKVIGLVLTIAAVSSLIIFVQKKEERILNQLEEIRSKSLGLELSELVNLRIQISKQNADAMRQTLAQLGLGKHGNYTHCSNTVSSTSRWMPQEGAHAFIGNEGVLETVGSERIEVVCPRAILSNVIEDIKKAHPYEETVIFIETMYQIGHKRASDRKV